MAFARTGALASFQRHLAYNGAVLTKHWTSSLATFGVAAGAAAIYFTDDWIGKEVLM